MNKSYLLAGAIAGAAGLWIASGLILSPESETELSAFEQQNKTSLKAFSMCK